MWLSPPVRAGLILSAETRSTTSFPPNRRLVGALGDIRMKTFPIREAYVFAAANSLANEAAKIREMEIEWDRSYNTSVRRGFLLREFERRNLLSKFIAESWPLGDSPQGAAERRRYLRLADEYDAFLKGHEPADAPEEDSAAETSLEFALEAHLRDFLAKNLDQIEPGLRLYQANGVTGVEFNVDGGRIDLLAIDKLGKFVVIELKLSQGRNKALGQLLYYMGWVDQKLGGGPCRGIVIASEIADELVVAISRTPGVSLSRYRMKFSIEKVGAV